MSDQVDASAQHGTVDSLDVAAPAKPSLRVLELGASGDATREEDLANGPCLLGLGNVHENPTVPYPGLDLGSQHTEYRRLEEIELPFMPLRRPEVLPTGPVSLPSISHSGASFSVPAEDTFDAIQSFLAELAEHKTTRNRHDILFSSFHEFSWHKDSGLYFGEELFEVVRTPTDGSSEVKPCSERALSLSNEPTSGSARWDAPADGSLLFNIAGIGGSLKHLSPTQLLENLELAPGLEISIYKFVDWILDLLVDDFFRSCAPNGSKKNAVRAQKKSVNASVSQTRGNSSSNKGPRPGQLSRKRKTLDGDEESEDEGSQGNRKMLSGKIKRRWACPFAQWNPKIYPQCVVGVSSTVKKGSPTIGALIDHIKKIHVTDYCHMCWSICTTSEEIVEHQSCSRKYSHPVPPPGLLTVGRQNEIFDGKDKGLSPEERWRGIYKVLFPGEPKCASPYVNQEAYEDLSKAERNFRYRLGEIAKEEMQKREFDMTVRPIIMEMVQDAILPRLFQEYRRDKSCFTPAHYESQELEIIQSSQTIVDGTNRNITGLDSPHHNFTQSANEAFASHEVFGQNSGEAPVSPAVYLSLGDIDTSAMIGYPDPEDPLSSLVPGDFEANHGEISRVVTHNNEESPSYWELFTNGNQLGPMPDAWSSSGNEVVY